MIRLLSQPADGHRTRAEKVHVRSIHPAQDTPRVRSARINARREKWFVTHCFALPFPANKLTAPLRSRPGI